MKLPLTALTFTGLFGSSVLLAADMHIPMNFEYLALDGGKVARSVVIHKSELALTPGYHEIALRYHDMVPTDIPDSDETVKSPAFIITLTVEGDTGYYLKPADGDTVKNPQEFAEAPDIIITQKDGGSVDYKVTHTDIRQKEFKTRLYGKTLSPEAQAEAAAVAAAAAAAAASPQLVPQTSASVPVVNTPATAGTTAAGAGLVSTTVVAAGAQPATGAAASSEHTATPEQMLQHWWQRADEQTRKEFLSWAIKQL